MKRAALLLLSFFVAFSIGAQTIVTFAGGGTVLGDGGPATAAKTSLPTCGSFDGSGNYYFAQVGGAPRVRCVNTSGIIQTVAGTGVYGFSGDGGPATNANIATAHGKVDSAGNIFIADYYNSRVRKVDVSTGIIHTIAGNGVPTHTGDGGPASAATLMASDLCLDKFGNIYVMDSARIRKIDVAGNISTVAGDGIGGFYGDGGPATAAGIIVGIGICTDSVGNLFIGCNAGTRIRKVDMTTGIISSIGGTGTYLYNGDNIPATVAQFKEYGMAFDATGNLYLADFGNQRIRKIDTSGFIHTVAGTGINGFSGDGGPATAAQIYNPEGVAIDRCGNLFVADDANNRIRKITFNQFLTIPSISISGAVVAPVGTPVSITATVSGAGSSYIIHWLNHGMEFTTTTLPSVTYTKGAGTDTITARVVSTAPYGCYDSTTSAGHYVTSVTTEFGFIAGTETLNIYPNPTYDLLNVNNVKTSSTYRLLDIIGVTTRQGTFIAGNNTISMKTLPAGIYVLELTDEERNRTVTKIIKQ